MEAGASKLTVGALLDGSAVRTLDGFGQESDVVRLVTGNLLNVEAETGDSSHGVEGSLVIHLTKVDESAIVRRVEDWL